MELFQHQDLPIKHVVKLPLCGCGKEAKYEIPKTDGVWGFLCSDCTVIDINSNLKGGFQLRPLKEAVTKKVIFEVTEAHNKNLVVTKIKPRIIVCSVCNAHHEVTIPFVGTMNCRICKVLLNVKSFFKVK